MSDPAYFAPLVNLPVVIDQPGTYRTREGLVVQGHTVSTHHDFGCAGAYPNGTKEHWHKNSRVLAGPVALNDIVARA
jgi:hypothetical protein